jgi:hypothetical protein
MTWNWLRCIITCGALIIDASYAVEGFGEATHPREIHIFSWYLPAKPASTTRILMILGGRAAAGTLWVNHPARATT